MAPPRSRAELFLHAVDGLVHEPQKLCAMKGVVLDRAVPDVHIFVSHLSGYPLQYGEGRDGAVLPQILQLQHTFPVLPRLVAPVPDLRAALLVCMDLPLELGDLIDLLEAREDADDANFVPRDERQGPRAMVAKLEQDEDHVDPERQKQVGVLLRQDAESDEQHVVVDGEPVSGRTALAVKAPHPPEAQPCHATLSRRGRGC
mmetsp:Transcript_78911/g.228089  ORF Transcript_78911/g.228089 Transcript_78911/m.228089 type:complete len:202 (-) Transcript_78911:674-1279(-)